MYNTLTFVILKNNVVREKSESNRFKEVWRLFVDFHFCLRGLGSFLVCQNWLWYPYGKPFILPEARAWSTLLAP